jgi:uncharacterized delta-60 repeat protein
MSLNPLPAGLTRCLLLVIVFAWRLTALAQPGALDPSFTFAPTGIFPTTAAVQSNGKVVIGGSFDKVHSQPRLGVARLNADGTLDTSFIVVKGLQVVNDAVIIGGAVLLPAGTNTGAVNSLDVQADGKIVIVGNFNRYDGKGATNIARLNSDGSWDATFLTGTGLDGGGNFVKVLSSGKILVSGGKKYRGTALNMALTRLNPDGAIDATFTAPVMDFGGGMTGISVQDDGKIVAAATYLNAAFKFVTQVIRLNENGSPDATFTRGTLAAGTIGRTAIQPGGKFLVAGAFSSTYENVPVKGLFRLNANGNVDSTLDAGGASSGVIAGLVAQADGQFLLQGLVAGNLSLARFQPDGAKDTGFNLPAGYGANGVWLQPDGKVLVSGNRIEGFTPVYGVFRLNGGASAAPAVPVITAPPTSQTLTEGGSLTFGVTASGVGPFTYRWKHNGTDIPGGDGATLTIPKVKATDAGEYSVVVANAVGSTTSTVAILTVNIPATLPVITVAPKPQTVAAGGSATFSVEATGTAPLNYQWLFKNEPINGANAATLTLTGVLAAQAGNYSVKVSNAAGAVTSAVSALVVLVDPPVVTVSPQSLQVTLAETNLTAAVLAGRVLTLMVQGGLAPWRPSGTYQIPLTATTYASPAGGGLTTASAGSYSVQPDLGVTTVLFLNNYFPDGKTGKLALLPDGRFELYADGLVANQNGRWTLTPPFTPAPGPVAGFGVVVTGTAPFSYQWKFNGADLPGATDSTLVITNTQPAHLGNYSVVVRNAGGSATSAIATLSAKPTGPVVGPGIKFSFSGGNTLHFDWPAGYTLQSSDKLTPPQWNDVPGAPPQNIPTAGSGKYFRLIQR